VCVRQPSGHILVMRYVALLRGINVGGKNKIDMAGLRAAFEAAGMADVTTYITSGNVMFSTARKDRSRAVAALEAAIQERFGFHVDMLLKDADQMRAIVVAIPADWANDQSTKCDVLYLWGDVDRPSIKDELDFRPEIEDVLYTPGAVIWRVDRKSATRSRLPRIVGTPLYKRITIRNCTTARKLAELLQR
jgi:uncharacterized protein (DUF1697 family)